MSIVLVILIILATGVILWWGLTRRRSTQKPTTYTCPVCGEHHCDCYREDETKPSGARPPPAP